MLDNRKVIIDEDLLMADTGWVAASSVGTIYVSAAATVDGVAKTYDTGGGYTDGLFVIDIGYVAFATAVSNCKLIDVCLEGSKDATRSTYDNVPLARLICGSAATSTDPKCDVAHSNLACTVAGRYIFPFHNDFGGTIYRYLRVYTTFLTATPEATGSCQIGFKAWLSKR
jgi:hypothetical protein